MSFSTLILFRPKIQITIANCTIAHPALNTEHTQYKISFLSSVEKKPIVENMKTPIQSSNGT